MVYDFFNMLKNCVLIVCMKSLLDFQREIPSTQLDTCTGHVEPNTTGSREPVSQLWLKIGHALGESAPLKLLNATNLFFFFSSTEPIGIQGTESCNEVQQGCQIEDGDLIVICL